MLGYKKIGSLLGIYLLSILAATAQFRFEKPIVISKENGLPANNVRSIRKGKDGFIWVGTSGGLCRFDGQQVRVYDEGKDPRYSIFDNSVNSVLPLDKEIWAGTNQGISVLNTTDNTFRHYQFSESGKTNTRPERRLDQYVASIYKDRTENIWIGTRSKGLLEYDRAKDDFIYFRLDAKKYPALVPSLGPNTGIMSIEASRKNDSIIWAGTGGGLLEVNKYNRNVKLYTFTHPNKDFQVSLNAFRRLYHHDDGLLYVGSWGAGINVFDPVLKTFTPLPIKNELGKKLMSSVIGNILRKNDHEFWFTCGLGLAIYDSNLKDVTWFKENNPVENIFYAADYIDEANRVWQGDMKGLQYFDPAMQQFTRFSFKELSGPNWAYAFYILTDSTGNHITVCPRLTDGIYHFDRIKKTWTKTVLPGHISFKTEKNVVRGFAQFAPGNYVITTYSSTLIFSEKQKRLIDVGKRLNLPQTRWSGVTMDHHNNVWLGADALGILKLNPVTFKYKLYGKEMLQMGKDSAFGRVVNFFLDSHDNIWFEKTNGYGVYVASKDSIVNFVYSPNKDKIAIAYSFAEDKKGRVWIFGGENRLGYAMSNDPAKGIVADMDTRKWGIPILYPPLAMDNNGEVWAYNSNELVRINSDNLSVTKYSFQYGLGTPDFYHFSFLPTGEMIFGGRNDITIANPSDLKRNTELPVPYIDQLEILNQPISVCCDGRSLRLKRNQNFFSIGFSAKAFTMAKEVRFRYRLNEFDDWKEVTGRRFATYTNVPGGDYLFQLQAANNEGLWNNKVLEFSIHVATAFWNTWWFRLATILAVGFAGYSYYRYRIDQLRKKEKLKSDYEKKLANVEMSALLAQMNPHFLFNSLNSIDSYIIRNESRKASEYLNNFARLMRLILQNSRSNYISLKDELEALDLYLQMESIRFKNKFDYSIHIDETIDTTSIVIPPMLIQPYVENAIWHGLMHKVNGQDGKVELNLTKQDCRLLCVIVDNGIGRKKAAEIKAQKHNNHKRSMGMQITEDRIEIINKLYNINASVRIYDVENVNGEAEGTKVELTIPV